MTDIADNEGVRRARKGRSEPSSGTIDTNTTSSMGGILEAILADAMHVAWSDWMRYVFEKSTRNADGTITIPAWAVERWTRQMNTPFAKLPKAEQENDHIEARRIISRIEL